MKRRALLSTALAASAPLCGCLGTDESRPPEGAVELDVSNLSEESHSVDLRVFSVDGSLVYEDSRTYPANHGVGLEEVAGSIGRVELSVDGGSPTRHEYDPTYEESCEEKNLHVKIRPATVDFDYYCQS